MAERRSHNYLADDKTDDLNHALLGIIKDGVYCGYEIDKTVVTGTDLELYHPTGYIEVDKDLNNIDASGVLVTKQGVIIKETEPVVLPIAANATAFWRIDTIICEHEYILTAGGAASSYSVVQGTAGATPAPAAIPNPEKQTIIGYLHISPNWADFGDSVIWLKNHIPTHDELTLKAFQAATYSSVNKTADVSNLLGNLFTVTFGGATNELHTILGTNRDSKMLILWFKDAGTIVTGGNIQTAAGVGIAADSLVIMLSYKKADGTIAYLIVSIQSGAVAYLGKHNNFTKTNSFAQDTLNMADAADYNSTTDMILTGANGNLFRCLNMDAGQNFKGIKVSDSEDFQNGTELTLAFYAQDSGDIGTLDLTTFEKPYGYTAATLSIQDGDLFKFIRENGVWRVIPITDILRRIRTLETGKVDIVTTIGSYAYSVLHANLEMMPLTSPNAMHYYKQQGRVWVSGRPIKAIGSMSPADVICTLNAGYFPVNGTIARGDRYFAVPKLSSVSISTPTVMITIKVDADTGEVSLYDTGLVANDMIDLRVLTWDV